VKLIVLKNNVPLNEVTVETSSVDDIHEFYVGRSEDCHVQIDDPLISRHHFIIRNQGKRWYCEKLSQLGVITLNGAVVSKNELSSGDEIRFSAYAMIVTDLPSATPLSIEPHNSYDSNISTPPKLEVLEQHNDFVSSETPLPVESTGPVEVVEANELEEQLVVETSSPPEVTGGEDILNLNSFESADPSTEAFSTDVVDTFDPNKDQEDKVSLGENQLDSTLSDEQSLVASSDNEGTQFFKSFVNYQLVLFGEHAPYDRYQIDRDEIFIGRDPKKCQIVLNDPEVSSVHAVLRKNNVDVVLEDLNSSNGTILNAERVNKANLSVGDEFVIGSTSFSLEVRSDLLESESERLMPVESGQVVETEELIEEEINPQSEEIDFSSEIQQEKSIIKRIMRDPVKRKKAIYVFAAVVLGYLFLLPEEQGDRPQKAKPKEAKSALADPEASKKLNLSKEQESARNVAYELGVSYFEQSRFDLAQIEFQKVVTIDQDYKKVQSYLEQTKVALKRIQELEAQKRAEEDRVRNKKIVDELLVKAREAVKDKKVQIAESFFSQIIEKDPENIEVSQLKLEIEAWQKEEERKALERAAKEKARKQMVDAFTPGKTHYLKKEWYRSILKLEEFLRLKGMDEDLVKEASDLLSEAKTQLSSELGPLTGKARSLKEGQDLKAAYEAYLEILKVEPTNTEALNEVDEIRSQLDSRSKRIYREAIIAESLSLFSDAKEKFQEVQQISPTDSEYYKKATEKLKNYLE
jgi:pSer/pThr/pTyr-binding forkhead associated (FHA) protein